MVVHLGKLNVSTGCCPNSFRSGLMAHSLFVSTVNRDGMKANRDQPDGGKVELQGQMKKVLPSAFPFRSEGMRDRIRFTQRNKGVKIRGNEGAIR